MMSPDDKLISVYALCEPDPPHAVRYVGQTCNSPLWRYHMHLGGKKSATQEWLQALRRLGKKALIRVLERVPLNHAHERELFHIHDQWSKGAPLLNKMGLPRGQQSMDAQVTMRMTRSLYDRLATLAEGDRRRIGEYVRLILEDVTPERERQARDRNGETAP